MTVCLCLQRGQTALHMAAQKGKVNVVKVLTEAKAPINIQTVVCTLGHAQSTSFDFFLNNIFWPTLQI